MKEKEKAKNNNQMQQHLQQQQISNTKKEMINKVDLEVDSEIDTLEIQKASESSSKESLEIQDFITTLKTQVEIFVNRMKSNSSRGRSITNDSSVQTLFMNTMSMHSQLLRYIQAQEDKRVYYEGLQDKLVQVKDARAALNALRDEERERKRREAEEAERIRQAQMQEKLEVALQRMQEQEREMILRQEQSQHQMYMGVNPPPQAPQVYGMWPQQGYPDPYNMQMMGGALPNMGQPQSSFNSSAVQQTQPQPPMGNIMPSQSNIPGIHSSNPQQPPPPMQASIPSPSPHIQANLPPHSQLQSIIPVLILAEEKIDRMPTTSYSRIKGEILIDLKNLPVSMDIPMCVLIPSPVVFSGGSRETIEFEHWIEDALCIIDRVCDPKEPILIVSSSVGSWISTIVAQKRPDRIHSMLFIGPAFNIIWKAFIYHYKIMSDEEKKRVDDGEYLVVNLKYGGKNYLRKDFSEKTKQFEIDTASPININCPVRIIHAVPDRDVSFETSLQIASNIATTDVDVILRKEGDHRLNTDNDTTQQLYEIHRLITQYPIKN
ncbi:HGS [Lepeophtheirus salmonis]|uniref:HGS n=1 Tax=Lepeophtheirus salmonis TaxID=72036 RepID=A0A7R8H6N3_LEPSM|nr:HGS [Lepeophtheirus salmonis]CAF2892342.1 HGS [Lepeophtheirus salmonis]